MPPDSDPPGNRVFQELASLYLEVHALHRAGPETSDEAPADNDKDKELIFLLHAKLDVPSVTATYDLLARDGFHLWFEPVDLVGGMDRNLEVDRAIRSSRFVVVFLSRRAAAAQGDFHRDLRIAKVKGVEQPEGRTFLVSCVLDAVDVPSELVGLERLASVALFAADGYVRLRRALRQS